MARVDIKKQPRMGLAQTVKITVHGIRYRLFRSFVTVMVIAVAIAFLMNILCESLVTRGVALNTRRQLAERRLAVRWVSRLSRPETAEETIRLLAAAPPGTSYFTEVQHLGEMPDHEMGTLRAYCARAAMYLDFFSRVDYAKARRLSHRARGTAIFDRLQDPAAMDSFRKALAEIKSLRLVTSVEDFELFLRNWPDTRAGLQNLHARRTAAVKELEIRRGTGPLLAALCNADGEFGRQIRDAGFELTSSEAGMVAALAREAVQIGTVEATIGDPAMRQKVAAYLGLLPSEVDIRTLWRMLSSRRRTEWYLGKANEAGLPLKGVTADDLQALAKRKLSGTALARAEGLAEVVSDGFMGMGERMSWLVIVSMVVCTVGIANAMLMAVTERFQEIATLKCLGALDTTIMVMFVLEACLFGVVGGLLGALLGAAIGLGRMLIRFRGLMSGAVPLGPLVLAGGTALVLGVLLAAVAALYPSFKAARLAPMEAMRIE